MKRIAKLIAAALPLAVPLAALAPVAASAATRAAPAGAVVRTVTAAKPACAPVPVSAPPGAKVESVRATHQAGGTVSFPTAPIPASPITGVPPYCEITVTLTHPGADDHVKVAVALPETGWNGRLQAVGGSAYAAGDFGAALVQAVKDGYSGVTTDAGVPTSVLDTSRALKSDGRINLPLVTNFASRSVHEAAVVGKDVTRRFYDRAVSYAYWNGCSTGGRQGYAEAQKYPGDFDGILAKASLSWAPPTS